MIKPTKDLFDDSMMTFGEHLEALRKHLILAILGLVVAVVICLYRGERIVDFVRRPIDKALQTYGHVPEEADPDAVKSGWGQILSFFGLDSVMKTASGDTTEQQPERTNPENQSKSSGTIPIEINIYEVAKALHNTYPDRHPAPEIPEGETSEATVTLWVQSPAFAQYDETVKQSQRMVTLNVQEPFMIYLKVSIIAGVVLASPWIFYQLWLFIAAGLYPHERKYVYVYGIMSLGLFLIGAAFCFYLVFPFVLNFLLQYNTALNLHPQIRMSEWISFAVFLPLMFGISFQLPLVMLFLQRINILSVDVYTQQRRMAILVIAILSAVLTPADPVSMLMMMFPLMFLYELGIYLCKVLPSFHKPFDEPIAS